jgi:toxin-antitoxin system PIN domain toxin
MASSEGRPLLLDVNALLALAWPNHQFHQAVVSRLDGPPAPRWASCALTQLGFVRLSSNPAVVGVRKTPAEALSVLTALIQDPRHEYIEALPALPSVDAHFRRLLGHQQVTDAYLVAVAETASATLLTLDRRILPPSKRPHLVEVLGA